MTTVTLLTLAVRSAGVIIATGAVLAGGARAAPERAKAPEAFPGRNGLIAFSRATVAADRRGIPGSVYALDLRWRSARRVARGAQWPAWSPDGRQLAVTVPDLVGDRWNMPNPSPLTMLPGAPLLVRVRLKRPAWAPDGHRLVGNTGDAWQTVWILDLQTGERRGIYEDEGAGTTSLVAPDWSPDGARIVFSADEGAIAFYDVALESLEYGERFRYDARDAVWSPDGQQIAFYTTLYGDQTRSSIYVARPDGTGRRLVVRNGHSPAWSPDGTQIAFVRMVTRTNSEIFVVNANGTRVRRLTHHPFVDTAPDWQPLPKAGRD